MVAVADDKSVAAAASARSLATLVTAEKASEKTREAVREDADKLILNMAADQRVMLLEVGSNEYSKKICALKKPSTRSRPSTRRRTASSTSGITGMVVGNSGSSIELDAKKSVGRRFVVLGAEPARQATHNRARPVVMKEKWQDDPIFDESKPDPVFDVESGYKGRVPYGLNSNAEQINGRAAMMGFTVVAFQEAITGKGVLQLYGIPYDKGAIVEGGGNIFIGIAGLIGAVVITGGLTYGGSQFYRKKLDPTYDGTKLPLEDQLSDKLPF